MKKLKKDLEVSAGFNRDRDYFFYCIVIVCKSKQFILLRVYAY